ncbi:MAG: hypothetical protein ACR2N3_17215 [Pyrinomonadaceae bacterium]
MPRGDKSKYTDKQKRQTEHIEESYEKKGLSEERAEEIAWSTVNKESGGGNLSGSGRKRKSAAETEPEVTKNKVKRKSSSVL